MNFQNVQFEMSCGLMEQLPASECPEVAFIGRSNVGKSSLINKVLGRRNLARVSGVPGKTATINFYTMDECKLVDLPGYGYAKASKSEKARWNKLISGYLNLTDRQLVLVIQLVDIRHAPSKKDVEMINFLIDSEIPFIIAFTKRDKLSQRQFDESMDIMSKEIPCFEDITCVVTSAEKGQGMEELRGIITDVIEQ